MSDRVIFPPFDVVRRYRGRSHDPDGVILRRVSGDYVCMTVAPSAALPASFVLQLFTKSPEFAAPYVRPPNVRYVRVAASASTRRDFLQPRPALETIVRMRVVREIRKK